MHFLSFYVRWFATLLLLSGLCGFGLKQAHAADGALKAGLLTVNVPGPIQIYVEDIGRGPPIVLLHGLGGSTYSFRHLIPELARRHRVVALDLKGFGRSDKPFDQAYTTTDQARVILAVMATLRLERVTLVGHSFGGAVALKLVQMTQDQMAQVGRRPVVSRLVLMNTPAFPQALSRHHALLQVPVLPYVALTVIPPILSARAMLATARPRGPRPTDEDAIAYADPLYGFDGKHALITTARQIVAANPNEIVPFYRRIHQSTLLIWCRNDPTVPEETGHRLARILPRAHLVLLDGCTHLPAEEAPHDTLRALYSFLGR